VLFSHRHLGGSRGLRARTCFPRRIQRLHAV
jgi:hypothetical protein